MHYRAMAYIYKHVSDIRRATGCRKNLHKNVKKAEIISTNYLQHAKFQDILAA